MKYSPWHNYWKMLTEYGFLVIQCKDSSEAFIVRRAMSNIKRRNPKVSNRNVRLASETVKNDDGTLSVKFWLHEQGIPPKLTFLN